MTTLTNGDAFIQSDGKSALTFLLFFLSATFRPRVHMDITHILDTDSIEIVDTNVL